MKIRVAKTSTLKLVRLMLSRSTIICFASFSLPFYVSYKAQRYTNFGDGMVFYKASLYKQLLWYLSKYLHVSS